MRNQDIPAGGSMEVHFNLPLRFQASLLCCCLFSSNKDDSILTGFAFTCANFSTNW